jgi:HD-GYP domain-containing protein (c-di-GMP phosphodiesterase class II)
MLHGAEKVGIPEEILKKPTALSGKELKIVKEYPKKSVRMLSPLVRLKPAIAILLHHHEKFDGTGYPGRLKGERIPLGSRVMAVADSFVAMVSRRPYRSSTSIPETIREIKKHSSRQFDPQVIEAFLRLTKRKSFKKILKRINYG